MKMKIPLWIVIVSKKFSVLSHVGDTFNDFPLFQITYAFLAINSINGTSILKSPNCLSKECLEASNRIVKFMNASADPCEDFSQFACGRFYKETIIPEDKENLGSFTYLGDIIDERGRILLEEPINQRIDFEGHQKAKLYYKGIEYR